jgi:UDP-glucuronate 4-epimerase
MKETVLVTGAAGFIGSQLAARLLSLGYRVIGLDNFDNFYSPAIKRRNIRALESQDGFQLIEGDIRDSFLLHQIFPKNSIEAVIHLAALAGVRPSLEQALAYQDVNVRGTINLLEASRDQGIKKFVFASSSSVYGLGEKVPFSEEAKIDYPISPYAASKAAAELFCRTYNHLFSLPVVVLRLFTVYGPCQRPEMAIHRFVKMVDQGEKVTIFGDGRARRDFTYIDDITAGFEAALAYPKTSFDIFNLGRGKTVELMYLLQLIEEALGKKARIAKLPPQQGDVPITLADISKARTMLGYQPKTSVEEGIPSFIRWYRENGGSS